MVLYYGLITVLFIEYIRPELYFPVFGSSKIGTILPLTLLGISFFNQSKISHADIWSSGNTKWLAFFLFMITVSLFTADVTLYAYIRITQTLGYFFLFYIICRYADDLKKVKGILFALVIIHIILIVLNPDIILHPEIRNYMTAGPFLGDGNDFALSLCVVFPMSLFLWLDSRSKIEWALTLGMLLIVVLAIVGTQSRGATLGVATILLYLWWESKNKIIGIVAIFLLVIVMLLFAPPEYFSRMETIQNYEEEGSAQGRIAAWKHATELALENPILGVGAGHFPALHGLTAHSMYFLVFAELGFPGVIYLIFFLFQMIFRNRKSISVIGKDPPEEDRVYRFLLLSMNASVIGFAVSGAFLSVLYYPHSFVLGAVTLVANRVYLMHVNGKSSAQKENNIKDTGSPSNKRKVKKFVNCN